MSVTTTAISTCDFDKRGIQPAIVAKSCISMIFREIRSLSAANALYQFRYYYWWWPGEIGSTSRAFTLDYLGKVSCNPTPF